MALAEHERFRRSFRCWRLGRSNRPPDSRLCQFQPWQASAWLHRDHRWYCLSLNRRRCPRSTFRVASAKLLRRREHRQATACRHLGSCTHQGLRVTCQLRRCFRNFDREESASEGFCLGGCRVVGFRVHNEIPATCMSLSGATVAFVVVLTTVSEWASPMLTVPPPPVLALEETEEVDDASIDTFPPALTLLESMLAVTICVLVKLAVGR